MKRNFFSMAAIAGIFLFTACNKDADTLGGEMEPMGSEITITLNSGGDITTRASRPVGSSAAANNVNKVDLKIFTSTDGTTWSEYTAGDILGTSTLTWTAGPTGEGTSTTDRTGTMKVKVSKLTAGTRYKIVAYGYDTQLPYGTATESNSVYTTGAITAGVNGAGVEEIFAGETSFTAEAGGKIPDVNKKVEMRRMVAGLIGYFTNVPVWRANAAGEMKKVTKITVEACASTTSFKFPFLGTNGKGGFNGISSTETTDVLLTYDLATLASNYASYTTYSPVDVDATYTFDANKAITTTPNGFVSVTNSIFGGRFLVPFSEQYNTKNTLLVKLLDDGQNVLKTFKVRSDKNATTGQIYDYGIERNHFYSIGKKLKTDSATEPTDPDEPVDLNKDNDLTVILNDAWDVLNDMGLDEI